MEKYLKYPNNNQLPMFDLTKEIQLEGKMRKKYSYLRALLYASFFVFILLITHRILFPKISLTFSFDNSKPDTKNALVSVRTDLQSEGIKQGLFFANDPLFFNANPAGNFSTAKITLTTKNVSSNLDSVPISLQKSYQAFLFPTGNPIGFRNGTLLASNGSYYIVSNGFLREFSSSNIVTELGYAKGAFTPVLASDLIYNQKGQIIDNTSNYPENTFFFVDDKYYEFKNEQLYPFVNDRAFLSQFDTAQAISKEIDFLNNYVASETVLGFADGTLGSSDLAVFILSEGKSYPILDPPTFVQMGFDWKNVIPLDSEELGIYENQKQFTRDQSHPDGTVFFDQEINKYYVIENGFKLPIENPAVLKTYAKQKPILASIKESEQTISCQLKKSFSNNQKYSCAMSIVLINNFIGNDYQFKATLPDGAQINAINVTFSTALKWENMRDSLSGIKNALRDNYISTQ